MQPGCRRGDHTVLRGAQRVKKTCEGVAEISPHHKASRQHASMGGSCTGETPHRVFTGVLQIWVEVRGFGKGLAQILTQPLTISLIQLKCR